jgi:hypothetical protein
MSSLASAFGRPRAELRHRMKAWARGVAERLRELGVDVQPRAQDGPMRDGRAPSGLASDEGASQRVRLVRAAAPVDAPRASASLTLTMDAGHVEVALLLPPDDLHGARERLADSERALELRAALEALPEQFAIGTSGGGPRIPASRASTDEVRALIDRAERERQALWLGWSVPRAVAVAHAAAQARARPHGRDAPEAPSLDEQLADAMVALGLLFAMLTPASPDDAATAGARPLRCDRRDRLPRLHAGSRRTPVRASRSASPVDKGARVRVLDGPFSGKVGVVQDLDGKGGARVMLGLLAVRVDVKDLAACADGRDRPRLSSSHRKPLPVRS